MKSRYLVVLLDRKEKKQASCLITELDDLTVAMDAMVQELKKVTGNSSKSVDEMVTEMMKS